MRPLLPEQKTALIFYLAFAGLLLIVTGWSPVKPAVSDQRSSDGQGLVNGVTDLSGIHSNFELLWEEALARRGMDQKNLILRSETRLEEEKFGEDAVKWVYTSKELSVPETVTEADLAQLAEDWKEINRALELAAPEIKWGYQGGRLWLRLGSEAPLKVSGGPKTVPVLRVTLIKKLETASQRGIPGLIPHFPPKVKPPAAKEPPRDLPALKKPRVAIIIDDVGYVKKAADSMLKVPARLTWAVLPFTPYASEYVEAAKERGFEIMLHLPLEPLDHNANPGPGLIKTDWPEEEIIKQFEANLDQAPGAVGVNNHMGSAGTADERLMDLLMGQIKAKGLYFVDSMTTDHSAGEAAARRHQTPYKKRDVFIDNLPDPDSKKRALRELIKIALVKGEAIGIGHVRNGTAEAIMEMLPEFEKAGIEIVPVSELFK
ncbi:MAG: divergent polysaccharide deacetylase family protein [Firmicutes bacterium]|nr:divergent polysaccharide deacetylase family protein [Bacillota bacterium]